MSRGDLIVLEMTGPLEPRSGGRKIVRGGADGGTLGSPPSNGSLESATRNARLALLLIGLPPPLAGDPRPMKHILLLPRRIYNILAHLRRGFPVVFAVCLLLTAAGASLRAQIGESHFVIVGGLGGEPQYAEQFSTYASALGDVFEKTTGDGSRVHVLKGPESRREAITALLGELAKNTAANDSVALILVGHGTWDGRVYKFNIPGPDLDAAQLRDLLDAIPARRQLLAVTSSASGAIIDLLKGENRVIITATRSGRESNATVFPKYWVEALSDDAADSDKNAVITAAEAFSYTERRVKDFFEKEKRLAGEHPRIEGDFAATFTLARLEKVVTASEDPAVRRLFVEREAIEGRVEKLKKRKDEMEIDAYFDELEGLMIELARKQAQIDEAVGNE